MIKHAIYALRYAGPLKKCGAHFLWQKDWEKTGMGNFYFWCIKNKEHTIIVDTGVTPYLAKKRNLPNYVKPTTLLSSLDIKAEEIQHVIITHLHWDHAGGVSLFPHATYYLHHQEYNFWIKDEVALTPAFQWLYDSDSIQYLKNREKEGKLILIEKEQEILPGVELIFAPGHSPALMAVAVNTKKGTAVLGSDAGYVFKNYQENWPSDVTFNMADEIKSIQKLREKASSPELLFPGHDPNLAECYPQIAENITRLV